MVVDWIVGLNGGHHHPPTPDAFRSKKLRLTSGAFSFHIAIRGAGVNNWNCGPDIGVAKQSFRRKQT